MVVEEEEEEEDVGKEYGQHIQPWHTDIFPPPTCFCRVTRSQSSTSHFLSSSGISTFTSLSGVGSRCRTHTYMYVSYEQHSRGTRDNTATCTYVRAHVHSIQLSSLVSHAGPVCDEESLFLGWECRGQYRRSKGERMMCTIQFKCCTKYAEVCIPFFGLSRFFGRLLLHKEHTESIGRQADVEGHSLRMLHL